MPQWRERHVPDIGIGLVEILAYVGDYLSYFQDAVATEQYLDTARQRISVRRHTRLVDYAMHEGCNARAILEMRVGQDEDTLDPLGLFFITGIAEAPAALRQSALETLPPGWMVFEPLTKRKTLKLRIAHNLIRIYTWGNEECCLPKGSTRATLLDEVKENDQFDPEICDERPWPPIDHEHHDNCGCGQKPPPPKPPRALDLEAGDFLLFEELACAGTVSGFDGKTSQPDVDRTHRHVVRITRVTMNCDALRGNRVLEVEWCRDDALPFALCVSAIGPAPDCDLVDGLAVARGNILLVDQGATIRDEPLPPVEVRQTTAVCEGEGAPSDVIRVAARYRPRLRRGPLTFALPLDANACASTVLLQNPRAALPEISLAAIPPSFDGIEPLFSADDFADPWQLARALLEPATQRLNALRRRLRRDVSAMLDEAKAKDKDEDKVTETLVAALNTNLRALTEMWTPRADLLDSDRDDADFIAEIDDDGVAHLRFGDGDCGRAVDVGMAFLATYRAGNGRAGLVGPDSIVHVVYRSGFSDVISQVRNPLPSAGAIDPEPVAEAKMFAPGAFRRELGRAVTAEDYATLAQFVRYPQRDPRVQSASGALRWNGSWYEADVALDPIGTSDLDPLLGTSVEQRLYRYRRMGHDLRIGSAGIVPIRLELDLCVKPDYLRAHVLAAVRAALSSRTLPGGRRGFFHPDNLTLGTPVYASGIIAAVMAVEGVAELHIVRLERLAHEKHAEPQRPIELLPIGPDEIARLDNDPAAPENGILCIRNVRGGR